MRVGTCQFAIAVDIHRNITLRRRKIRYGGIVGWGLDANHHIVEVCPAGVCQAAAYVRATGVEFQYLEETVEFPSPSPVEVKHAVTIIAVTNKAVPFHVAVISIIDDRTAVGQLSV